jgi:hypothetical protein
MKGPTVELPARLTAENEAGIPRVKRYELVWE